MNKKSFKILETEVIYSFKNSRRSIVVNYYSAKTLVKTSLLFLSEFKTDKKLMLKIYNFLRRHELNSSEALFSAEQKLLQDIEDIKLNSFIKKSEIDFSSENYRFGNYAIQISFSYAGIPTVQYSVFCYQTKEFIVKPTLAKNIGFNVFSPEVYIFTKTRSKSLNILPLMS